MRRCAFLTTDDLSEFVTDDDLTHDALRSCGWDAVQVPWRSACDWSAFDLVVVRTPWDYQHHADEFLHVLHDIDRATHLENPLRLMQWNMRKTYLRDLHARAVLIPPTSWVESPSASDFQRAFDTFAVDEVVIKPQVGANAGDTLRVRSGDARTMAAAVALFAGRAAMIQPFLRDVVSEGEYSVIFLGGEPSHSILKTPKQADFRVQEEHGGVIRRVDAEPLLLERARRAMDAAADVMQAGVPLYGRADFVRTGDDFALMELELIEPSLYFRLDAASPGRFADAVSHRMSQAGAA